MKDGTEMIKLCSIYFVEQEAHVMNFKNSCYPTLDWLHKFLPCFRSGSLKHSHQGGG